MRTDPRYSAKLLGCLSAVYFIWGSTFLFTKIAVEHLPIALYSAVRFLTAGTVLATVARFGRGEPWPRRLIDWRHVAVTGFFMVFVSNGLNAWAMQFIPTNQSALLNGTAAFWIAGLGVFGPRGHPLTRWAILGLTVGFAGTTLMLIPHGELRPSSFFAQLGVLVSCLAFSLGTLYYRGIDTSVGPLMFMAMQLCCGGLMLFGIALARGDAARWTFNAPGLIALGYLTFVSSCLAFTAYGWLTRNATPAVIGTYSYVNPAIAAFLGWQFMHEHLTGVQLIGMVVIIVGVSILTLPGGSVTDPKTLAEPKTQ
jgi:drug/metabolite transporter (DMT)-like permease